MMNKDTIRHYKNFEHAKEQCLCKRDKSSVGHYDDGVIEICNLINQYYNEYYTTSSCSGRCFIYNGIGIKSTTTFTRCRISHNKIIDPIRYFNLSTIDIDPTGGGDPITIYDGGKRQRKIDRIKHKVENNTDDNDEEQDENENDEDDGADRHDADEGIDETEIQIETILKNDNNIMNTIWWIRFEPFILHVACRSLHSAHQLMTIVRPIFKNVGITSLPLLLNSTGMNDPSVNSSNTTTNNNNTSVGCPKYLVAIWGDEGLDMPLTNQDGISLISMPDVNNITTGTTILSMGYTPIWLASLINERHERNTMKIAKLVQAIRNAIPKINEKLDDTIHHNADDDVFDQYIHYHHDPYNPNDDTNEVRLRLPRSYDVIGDVAILHSLPITPSMEDKNNDDKLKEIGDAIIQRNKAIKVVVVRLSNLEGIERAPGMNGIQILTGPTERIQRLPLITTHREYGISCIVDIHNTFFSPRMGQERIRICQQVGRNEHVLVLFAGVCMDAFQIVARTEASSVTAIEYNEYAISCANKGHALLRRNKQSVQVPNAAERLQIIHGDCLDIIPTLPKQYYHRIIAPRPKEGNLDGNQPLSSEVENIDGAQDDSNGSGGKEFLIALLSVIQPNGGMCHWYDFCADHEYPQCTRTVSFLSSLCKTEYQYSIEIINIAHVGSVAKRQLRICVDFRVTPLIEI